MSIKPVTRMEKGPPGRFMRLLLRAPIYLYKAHLGFVLGQRFLLLTHVGRTSGMQRQAVVEVVHHDPDIDTYFIASGWGERSDWLQNVKKTPHVTVQVGGRRFETDARRLPPEEAAQMLGAYAQRHPRALRQLMKFILGEPLEPTLENVRRLADVVPLLALPAPGGGAGEQPRR